MESDNASSYGNELQVCENQLHLLNQYAAPMPWIGMYIAAASLLCTILMGADLVSAIHWRKYWFPSKYFTLNAATLTLLGVVVKLLLDISSPMPRVIDYYANQSSKCLLVTILKAFAASLGSLDDKSLLTNVIALSILVVTVCVNILIQLKAELNSSAPGYKDYQEVGYILVILLLLFWIAFLSRSFKRSSEVFYNQKYGIVLNEERLREGKLTTARLELVIKRFWIMSLTCANQFLIRHILYLMDYVVLFVYLPNSDVFLINFNSRTTQVQRFPQSVFSSSDYSWSIIWILRIQAIGSFIGLIHFVTNIPSMMSGFKSKLPYTQVDNLYMFTTTLALPIQFQIAIHKCTKLLSCIYQNSPMLIPVVFFLKIMVWCILIIPVLIGHGLRSFWLFLLIDDSPVRRAQVTELDVEQAHLAGYAIFVNRLSKIQFHMIYYEQHHLIQTGKRKQPKNLFQLLERSKSFMGVNDFDHIQVPDLHSKELPTCWTLPVMTLARIAVSLPQEDNESCDNLITSVTEGLRYADFVDQSLEVKQDLHNIRNAVKWIWQDVEIDSKWQNEKPIMRTSREAKFSKDILQDLAATAQIRVDKFRERIGESTLIDYNFWPYEVVAAYSMYRISSTLLLAYDEEGNTQTTAADDDGLLEKIVNMIADMLSACLTNLPYRMIQECTCNPIETLEDRVRHVSRLFGECEEILKLLESREAPLKDPEKALHIDEWQAFFRQGNANDSTPIPNNVNDSPSPAEEHVSNAAPSPAEEHVSNAAPSPAMEDIV